MRNYLSPFSLRQIWSGNGQVMSGNVLASNLKCQLPDWVYMNTFASDIHALLQRLVSEETPNLSKVR
jgi:hypothetical protein